MKTNTIGECLQDYDGHKVAALLGDSSPPNKINPPSATPDRENKRDHAVDAARRGFAVFKLPRNAKAPPPEEFFNVATTDPHKVFDLWTEPVSGDALDNNIGIVCDNLLVVDVDVKGGKPGEQTLAALIKRGLNLKTLTSRTPSGGRHLLYSMPPGIQVANSATTKLGPGLDVRGYHGYVAAPGSTIDGREYQWVDPTASILPAPDWLIAKAGAPKPRATRDMTPLVKLDQPTAIEAAIDYLVNRAPEAVEGCGGDNTTVLVANGVIDFGLSVEGAFEVMRDHWNETKAFPSWDPDELRTKIQNAWNYRTEPPGIRFPWPAVDEFDAVETRDRRSTTLATRRFKNYDFADARTLNMAMPYLIKGLVDKNTIVVIYGKPGSGKTFVALDMAYSVALGRHFQGRRVRRGLVVYITLEGPDGFRRRLHAIHKTAPLADGETAAFNIVCDRFRLTSNQDIEQMIEHVRDAEARHDMPCKMIVIDTLAKATPGIDESATKDIGVALDRAEILKARLGCAVVLVHHSGKDEDRGPRGSSSISGTADTELHIKSNTIRTNKQRDGK